MADLIDDAAEASEMILQDALRARAKVPEKTGFCLACDEPTEGAFCCPECREDYEKRTRMNAIKGNRN